MADFASKTAKASIKAGQMAPKDTPVLSDAERIRLIRIECNSNIYPSCENAHALLRAYDALQAKITVLEDEKHQLTDAALVSDLALKTEVAICNDLRQQITVLQVTNARSDPWLDSDEILEAEEKGGKA